MQAYGFDMAGSTRAPLPGLKEQAAEIYRRCQDRYPTVRIPPEAFSARLEEILANHHREHHAVPTGRPCDLCAAFLRQLHHEDLFLALACAGGERVAWQFFADEYLPLIRRLALNACRSCDAGEDLAQELVLGLLGPGVDAGSQTAAGRGAAEPAGPHGAGKLAGYNGRGSLAGWLRAAIAHAAIDRFRRERRLVPLDEAAEGDGPPEALPKSGNPSAEEDLDRRWGRVISQALQEEIAQLPARDRLLLNLHHLQGVPLKRIGAQYGVHEATASRWLDRIREGLRKGVERTLRKSHGLRPRDISALWRSMEWAGEAAEALGPVAPAKNLPAGKMQGGAT
jgi:RNA polymerase sigma factor (sigma-70 family)